jgi:lysozyme
MNEGFIPTAYQDTGGVWTIGYGETENVRPGQTTTPQRALIKLQVTVDANAQGVVSCIKVPLYQNEFDAYVDLAYNVGVPAFCNSVIAKKANAGDYEGACKAIEGWYVHDKRGNKLSGLVHRRHEESVKCLQN